MAGRPLSLGALLERTAALDARSAPRQRWPWLAALLAGTVALDNGVGRTPAMGWNSWNSFRCDINEQRIREVADALVRTGLAAAGYKHVVLDDCWMEKRADDGTIVPFASKFPSGMRALGEYIHARGLRFGLYSNAGRKTCEGYPGSWEHEAADARTYAAWGVDYVKYDFCDTAGLPGTPRAIYERMASALNATGRPIIFSLCNWGVGEPHLWGARLGHSWRMGRDVFAAWDEAHVKELKLPGYLQSVMSAVDGIVGRDDVAGATGPGGFNDPDMLVVGLDDGMFAYGIVAECPSHVRACKPGDYVSRERWGKVGGLSRTEQEAHFAMWAFLAAPLMLGNDPRALSAVARRVLLSPDLIAINQDELVAPARRSWTDATAGLEVWTRALSGGRVALLVLNRGEAHVRSVTTHFERDAGEAHVQWARELQLDEPCVNANADAGACATWAAAGECVRNGGYMAAQCARACSVCAPLAAPTVRAAVASVRDAAGGEDLGMWAGGWIARHVEPHSARVVVLAFKEPRASPPLTLAEPVCRVEQAAGVEAAVGAGNGALASAEAAARAQQSAIASDERRHAPLAPHDARALPMPAALAHAQRSFSPQPLACSAEALASVVVLNGALLVFVACFCARQRVHVAGRPQPGARTHAWGAGCAAGGNKSA